jgi:hypothetical protein
MEGVLFTALPPIFSNEFLEKATTYEWCLFSEEVPHHWYAIVSGVGISKRANKKGREAVLWPEGFLECGVISWWSPNLGLSLHSVLSLSFPSLELGVD